MRNREVTSTTGLFSHQNVLNIKFSHVKSLWECIVVHIENVYHECVH